ncbi:MAG: ribosome biogenesis GTPase Der [Simkaniaceae bacterium]|nr:ribosome biogenesis GTPase Der [Simkaniaceae bacterium]
MLKVALVGRPNVGKSSIFNRIVKKRMSIVDEQEGVTRDRLYADADFFGKPFELIDTGGIDPRSTLPFNEVVRLQALIAIEEADILVLVVDGRLGPTPLDEEVARIVNAKSKRVVVAVNKIDDTCHEDCVHQFYNLGIKRVVGISAQHGHHIAEMLEMAFEGLEFTDVEEKSTRVKVAIVGRPNVGKSTFLNYIMKEDRAAVSEVAGTTRDSIDCDVVIDGTEYTLIDTAGVRRKAKESDVIDKFAAIRTERAIKRSDVCILLIDANDGLTVQEKHIANTIEEAGKGCVIVFNKWDMVKGFRMEHCQKQVRDENSFLNHCPMVFISAKTGRNVEKVFPEAKEVSEQLVTRITTSPLNALVEKAQQKYSPPMIKGKRLRIYYLSQIGISPPHFVLFINHKDRMTRTYEKYIVNQLRKTFPFTGCPLKFDLRPKGKKEPKHD